MTGDKQIWRQDCIKVIIKRFLYNMSDCFDEAPDYVEN